MVFIQGDRLPGSDRLKELSKKEEIKLYISDYVTMEVYQGPLKVFQQKIEFLNTHKEHNKDFFAKMNEIIKKEYEREFGLERESDYWKDCKINYCKSIIGGLIAIPAPLRQSFITQFYENIELELSRFGQLKTKYNIKLFDSVHLMEAQGSEMNWFITEDKDLKNRANRIPWLVFRISKLEEFLRTHNWSGEK